MTSDAQQAQDQAGSRACDIIASNGFLDDVFADMPLCRAPEQHPIDAGIGRYGKALSIPDQ